MKKLLGISITLCLILTGCGNAGYSDSYSGSASAAYENYEDYSASGSAGINSKSASNDYAEEAAADYSYEETADESFSDYSYEETADTATNTDYTDTDGSKDDALTDAENKKPSVGDKGVVNTEMLVYTCNVSIRTEKFDSSYELLKNLIHDMGGFIESENYSENASSYKSSKTTDLTVRIPSGNFNNFLDSFGDIGTVITKSSNAQNVSREYSDTEKALEIYEAELERYIERIKTIKDESALLELESKITELQVKIAQLKSRRSEIETDVAYSYVYITLSESVYKEEPKTSFGGRFLNTVQTSLHNFLEKGEGFLFFLIMVLPELIVIFIVAFVIIKLIKRSKRKKAEKAATANRDNVSDKVDESTEK